MFFPQNLSVHKKETKRKFLNNEERIYINWFDETGAAYNSW